MTRAASPSPAAGPVSYEESKRLARDPDVTVRARLAMREDVRPEILYFLAEDASSEVRRSIAANHATPRQADLILARDGDEAVRCHLAAKVARLMPDLDAEEQAQAQKYLIEVIEILAQDEAVRVRQIVAEALKDVAAAPPDVIQRLARDVEDVVACPILEFSPLLSDEDLIEIIRSGCVTGRLKAISRRNGVGERVTDAIIETDDTAAIAELLDNTSAQIREETLDSLVDAALEVTTWHGALVRRPELSLGAVRKLAGFVAESLLGILQARTDLDRKTARAVAKEVRRRLKDDQKRNRKRPREGGKKDEAEDPAVRARRLFDSGQLDDEAMSRALNGGDRDLVRHGLALRAGLPVAMVDHILSAHSAKGVTALAWKAKCPMRFATQLQIRMGGIAPAQALKPRGGINYPMTPDEMTWQLEFFEGLVSH
ncbi:MAG: DUF2336 domain-containing protein [Alphaproteobacteria bacterium]|nr:MAG: DUF2336 domain-containing protein [Alphaproteobacteria bacterium]